MKNKCDVILESKTKKFIEELEAQGGDPIYTLPAEKARKVLEDAQSVRISKCEAQIEDRTFPVGPTGEVSVSIYRHAGATGLLPVAMYFHGGGWVLGSRSTHDRLLKDLVHNTPAAFVFVNYTPSPEAQFPVPIEQAYAATKYVAEHGHEMGLDGSRLAVIGDSVGGNMAAVVALLAKERGGPVIRYQVLCYPVTDSSLRQKSYSEFAEGPWLTKPAMEWFWDNYAPNKKDRKDVKAAPLKATVDQLKGLPPALIMVDENDILRDEGEEYARKLSLAGNDVTAVRYLGTFHDFMMLNGLADTPAAEGAILLASRKLTETLTSQGAVRC